MAYTALYRKFRPQTFEDVKGQEHIVTTLKNQLKAGRIGHAYLFCGTRGTGKTTIAKIMARAVNCEDLQDGSPCGKCAMCRAIADGSSLNVVEIDAASNNSVENVRSIIEQTEYPPVEGRYKVYIMDEAHMLSMSAVNALLKTLEEPPSYVIFILATTEYAKIPITIMSRCQRYDFRRISIPTIAARMRELTQAEGIDVEERALLYVAKAADGSMRDGLSILDQCVAFHYGETLTYDMVLDILGAVDTEVFERLLRMVSEDDILGGVELVEEVVMQGRDLTQFVTDFIWFLRNLMLLQAMSPDMGDDGAGADTDGAPGEGGEAETGGRPHSDADLEELLNVSSERLRAMRVAGRGLDVETLLYYIEVFSELSSRLRHATQKRTLLEMYLIRLMRPQMATDQSAVLERVRKVERQMEEGALQAMVSRAVEALAAQGAIVAGERTAASAQGARGAVDGASGHPAREIDREALLRALPEDIKRVVTDWPVIVGRTDTFLRAQLQYAKLRVRGLDGIMDAQDWEPSAADGSDGADGPVLQVCFPDSIVTDLLSRDHTEHQDELRSIIDAQVGKQVEVEFVRYHAQEEAASQYDDLRQLLPGVTVVEEA